MTVAVMADGTVRIDGSEVALVDVPGQLRAAAQGQKQIWYYRENAHEEPTGQVAAASDAVMQAIVENGLAISLSTRADFSDYVDEEGVSRPRGEVQ